eukprot:COSAG05_NODE_12_length_37297_cov_117.537072_32_plen_196_part_00
MRICTHVPCIFCVAGRLVCLLQHQRIQAHRSLQRSWLALHPRTPHAARASHRCVLARTQTHGATWRPQVLHCECRFYIALGRSTIQGPDALVYGRPRSTCKYRFHVDVSSPAGQGWLESCLQVPSRNDFRGRTGDGRLLTARRQDSNGLFRQAVHKGHKEDGGMSLLALLGVGCVLCLSSGMEGRIVLLVLCIAS